MIRGVGKELRFQTKTVAWPVGTAALSVPAELQIVPGIELDTRQRGVYLHGDPRGSAAGFCRAAQSSGLAGNNEIVVEPPRLHQLQEAVGQAGTDRGERA